MRCNDSAARPSTDPNMPAIPVTSAPKEDRPDKNATRRYELQVANPRVRWKNGGAGKNRTSIFRAFTRAALPVELLPPPDLLCENERRSIGHGPPESCPANVREAVGQGVDAGQVSKPPRPSNSTERSSVEHGIPRRH